MYKMCYVSSSTFYGLLYTVWDLSRSLGLLIGEHQMSPGGGFLRDGWVR